jgi:phosphohistidine phosphatase
VELIILRHGEAGKSLEAASRDAERALTVAGRKEVEEVAGGLARLKVDVGRIATSPLKRAKETALIAAEVLKREDLVEEWEELSPEGETTALYQRLSRLRRDSVVLLVGHEPYLSGLIGELVCGTRQARIILKKAGVAKVEVSTLAPKPSGDLRWLMTPRQMKKID